ncbi:uncharacterized protein HMPREF1541_06421 [Cyphellophora europaea CBS 101466]|uniref:NAD-dependent epimerase/dehydratase domain-containing protein n=1 Tax=Cyphellophora europaea (strain CBS 101466) TaxID=1220924 RepID=W2RPG5_CYPE1|nr:uncharacterized protein HMPREF1541_06421 [Cyphellophora europaea CBS 101466]ETN38386.1 hypothetical protein HMPREF1541_06421 [Cyphellophora europaea CBS 101466]
MAHRILITGGSGYLGGSLLAALPTADLPPYEKLYALVRTDEQAAAVKQYGAEPVSLDPKDEAAVRKGIIDHSINIVFFLVDAFTSAAQVNFIRALGELKKTTGKDVHFLHTTGAKMFSSHTGAPTDGPLKDDDPNLYQIHQAQKSPISIMQTPIHTNLTVTEESLAHNVSSYIFAPCIVYGRGTGFGNVISIQTAAIVRAAKATRKVYSVDDGEPCWPVCHVSDNTGLYLALLSAILAGSKPPSGKQGFYLASSGLVKWVHLYAAMAAELKEQGVVDTAEVRRADEAALEAMARGLGCGTQMVGVQLGGKCTFMAEHGRSVGWVPNYKPEHVLEAAGEEVRLILEKQK